MYTVRQLLQEKGNQVWIISPDATVYQALELMAAKNCGSLVVVQDGKVVGILSERDYSRGVVLKGKSSRTMSVGDLMTTEVLYISPDDTIENCMALMTKHRTRHLPVMDNGQLAGLISIGDVVKQVIDDREF